MKVFIKITVWKRRILFSNKFNVGAGHLLVYVISGGLLLAWTPQYAKTASDDGWGRRVAGGGGGDWGTAR